jgi:pyruvate kinase
VNYDEFARDVIEGNTLLVDSGEIRMRIHSKSATQVECEVLTPGTLGSRRHINLPGVRVSLPALTEKDRTDVKLGLELGVDHVALSFVRDPADMEELRQLTCGAAQPPQLVAKIEHQFAVNHFEDIARASDAVMVARGDLGIECPFEELPLIQRRIVKRCIELGKPVIVATQMLESMTVNPMPTRAEITDVANAVFEQADAIMLSGETTTGRYPLGCVEVMDRIARRIERHGGANFQIEAELTRPREKLVRSGVLLADELRAAAIIVFTRTGQMPRYCSWLRPRWSPIHAFATAEPLAQQLTLCRGLTPHVLPSCFEDPESSVEGAITRLLSIKALKKGDSIVVLMPPRHPVDQQTDTVKMRVV